jgi:subtilisin family serine protease
MAQGSSVWNASSSGTTSYGFNGSGTSYACPLAAGAAALVIKARLNATAIQVINALKSTASNASSPNNLIGWGTINVVAAINSIPATNIRENGTLPSDFHLEQNYPNPFNPSTSINYSLPEDAFVTVKVYDALGREVKTLISGHQTAESYRIVWNGTDASGRSVASGMYLYRIVATNASGKVFADSKRMILLK